jgi:phosphohistidine phosphatase
LLSSTANRALSTALFFAKELGIPEKDVVRMDELYHASSLTITRILNELPSTVRRVMVFCHNPGITEAVEHLSAEDIGNMPTCGLVRIDFPGDDWAMVSRELGTLAWMEYPKRHPNRP